MRQHQIEHDDTEHLSCPFKSYLLPKEAEFGDMLALNQYAGARQVSALVNNHRAILQLAPAVGKLGTVSCPH